MISQAIYSGMHSVLPFSWAQYDFMKGALLAVILMTPLFALVGTAVVSKRMAFFSDVLGHSALTGVALGVLLGMSDPFWVMLIFVVALAVCIYLFKGMTHASSDTTLGVFFAITVAFGVMMLSKDGGFNRYTAYLIGDILTVSIRQLAIMFVVSVLILAYWLMFGNRIILTSINPILARSKGVSVAFIEISFVIVVAVLVAISLKIIGILMINSLLVLPAASARIVAGNTRAYTIVSVAISLVSGVVGLICSYYWGTASGATIILLCAGFYFLFALAGKFLHFTHSKA